MTEREQVSFQVYNTTTNTFSGTGTILPYDNVAFNVGGTYDAENYKYTFLKSGTYIIGFKYNKTANNNCVVRFAVERSGIMTEIHVVAKAAPLNSTSVEGITMYNFLENDILYCRNAFGTGKMNKSVVPTGSIYNSFWGIRISWI